MKKPTLTMLVGLPGSGKSTYVKENFLEENIFSSDAIREELFGSDNNKVNTPENNQKVFTELHKRIKERLKSGQNAVYDATNINCKRRMAFLRELKNIPCKKYCVIIATPYEQCLINNKNRERNVPNEVIKRMYMNWSTPYYFEGWDQIEIYYTAKKFKNMLDIFEWLEDFYNYNQKNHHHQHTLGQHCISVGNKLSYYNGSSELVMAGYIHDCGKPFTQSFKDKKEALGDEAHYYQHHCVGAYNALFFKSGLLWEWSYEIDKVKVSALINYHMHPYFWENDEKNGKKTAEKYKELWGEGFYNDVMKLHTADLACH